jgi:hypothetical protein
MSLASVGGFKMASGLLGGLRERAVLRRLRKGIISPDRAEELLGRELTHEELFGLEAAEWRNTYLPDAVEEAEEGEL